ncbi:MAG: cytochrome c-type biogenesis protein CcmH [Erythrobacter sp.]|nr:cytochrome c-type biogenesis protein CcmH [Erythrobacter sp.]
MLRALLAALLALIAVPLLAQSNVPPAPYAYTQLDDPRLEAEAHDLMLTIRCLQCQSQSIADSDAPIAGDMRHQIRTRIAAGESPEAIRAWLIARYGDYISYEPQISSTTWPLFVLPVILLLAAGTILLRRFRGNAGKGDAA